MEDHATPPSGDEQRADLSTADINDLPDSAFAYIEPGGTKDAGGKTVPRDKRHFPIHDKAHVLNALSRAPQSPFGDKAMPKIKAAAKKFGVGVQNNSLNSRPRRKERHRAVPLLPEVRYFTANGIEIREQAKTDEIVLTGTPIVYNAPYTVVDMFGEFEERMSPGVVSDVLARGVDCRFLVNHEGLPLARTNAGTLSLRDTPEGLTFTAVLDARSQLANDLYVAVSRGDVTQMSCGFVVSDDEWNDDMDQRTIHRFADLLDVSAVTYPASPTTSIEVQRRMVAQLPLESFARSRQYEMALRTGKVLSASSQEKLVAALSALHDLANSGGVDPKNLSDDDPPADGQESANESLENSDQPTSSTDDGTIGASSDTQTGPGATADGTGFRDDPGEKVTTLTSSALRVMIEARKRRPRAA